MIDNKENDVCEQHNTEECASLEEGCPVRFVSLPFRLLVHTMGGLTGYGLSKWWSGNYQQWTVMCICTSLLMPSWKG